MLGYFFVSSSCSFRFVADCFFVNVNCTCVYKYLYIYIYMFYFYEPFQIIKRVPFDILAVLFFERHTSYGPYEKRLFVERKARSNCNYPASIGFSLAWLSAFTKSFP